MFVSAKDENVKVRCTLCTGDKVLPSLKNITSDLKQHCRSIAQLSLQSKPHQVVLNRELQARASTSAGGPPPAKQEKLYFSAKQVSGGELRKLVGWYVVEEMLLLLMLLLKMHFQ